MVCRKNQRIVSSSIAKKLDDAQTNEIMLDSNDESNQSSLVNAMVKEGGTFKEHTRKTLKLFVGEISCRQKSDVIEHFLKNLIHAEITAIEAQSNKETPSQSIFGQIGLGIQ